MNKREINRTLCYFRNLVYTTYREARHLGSIGTHPKYIAQASKCRIAKEREAKHKLFRMMHHKVQARRMLSESFNHSRKRLALNCQICPQSSDRRPHGTALTVEKSGMT